MKIILIAFLVLSCSTSHSIAKNWHGDIDTDRGIMNVIVKITKTDNRYKILCDVEAMNLFGVQATDVEYKDGILTFALNSIGATYSGKLSDDGTILVGMVTLDNGSDYPLEAKIISSN